jgi:hypothetical protein
LLDFYEKIKFCWSCVLFLLPLEPSIFPLLISHCRLGRSPSFPDRSIFSFIFERFSFEAGIFVLSLKVFAPEHGVHPPVLNLFHQYSLCTSGGIPISFFYLILWRRVFYASLLMQLLVSSPDPSSPTCLVLLRARAARKVT